MREGDIVICLKNKIVVAGYLIDMLFTIGNHYTIVRATEDFFYINNDKGVANSIYRGGGHFKLLSLHRDELINDFLA